ncbi:helix-turn-helix domain-containing protein [Streptomyces sp. NPDC088729]|uniref:helix-turn-helix domain-containing protein n=1 Tax=Streptomyces sp. NPDC088729 TaxID=3365876 RepID=UPI00380A8304
MAEDAADEGAASLRSLRLRARLSQTQLADLSTLSVRALRDLENGRVLTPRHGTIQLLAAALRVDPDQLRRLPELSGRRGPGPRPPRASGPRNSALPPVPDGVLIGRDHELGALMRLLGVAQRRLITVAGIAGVGKTRLALELARRVHACESVPVHWVRYDELPEGCGLPGDQPALPHRVRESLRKSLRDSLGTADRTGRRRPLLVLDGVRHARRAEEVIAELLVEHAQLRVVVTTRDTAGTRSGSLFPLAPLPPPDIDQSDALSAIEKSAAAQLLLTRMRQLNPSFELTSENASAIASICLALDGIPGALEFSALGGMVYSPHQLADRLAVEPLALEPRRSPNETRCPDIVASLRAAERSLTAQQQRVLFAMAERSTPWSIPDVVGTTGIPETQLASDMCTLLMLGLVRRTENAEQPRFHVLNTARCIFGQGAQRAA